MRNFFFVTRFVSMILLTVTLELKYAFTYKISPMLYNWFLAAASINRILSLSSLIAV